MRLLYGLSVYALMVVLFLYFLWRSIQEPAYRQRWLERLGFVDLEAQNAIWIHAASVGEVQAATPLIGALLARDPQARVLVTTFTPTGSELVVKRIREQWGDRVQHCYLPLDTPTAVNRFLGRVQPRHCVILETELWPNLLFSCQQREVPVSLVSATISERSESRYQSFPANRLVPPALQAISRVLAQTEDDASRFVRLGVEPCRVEVVGNIKFDYRPPAQIHADAQALRDLWHAAERPVWVAASTHEGEEQMLLDAFRHLKQEMHDLLLVIVPRHPQRFDRVYKLCREARVSVGRFSRADHVDEETEVVLGDTLGDLLKFMALADVVFMGGSLVPVGGHNLLEPAALEKAVICGPYMESQAQLCRLLLNKDAIVQLTGADALKTAVQSLFDTPQFRTQKGAAALAVVDENQGVVRRCVDLLSLE